MYACLFYFVGGCFYDYIFTGCTHFGHKNIIALASRPFEDVTEMNETLIRNWNRVVKDGDTIYHLGDVAMTTTVQTRDFIKQLNGNIVFTRGNHDKDAMLLGLQQARGFGGRVLTPSSYHESTPKTPKPADPMIVMCHYPLADWNGRYRGALHVHCHTHSHSAMGSPQVPPMQHRVNVSVEAWDYTPASLEQVLEVWKHLT